MDHELKQRVIGAVVVTALCAIFIPMLFDDPVDNSGQSVSELSIPAPSQGGDTAGKVPANAEQVLKSTDSVPALTPGETLESTATAEEAAEPDAGQSKQGNSGEALYAESDGYGKEDAGAEEGVEPADNQAKPRSKSAPAVQSVDAVPAKPLSLNAADAARIKQAKDEAAAKEAAKIKKAAETVKPPVVKEATKPAVKKPEVESPVVAKIDGAKAGAITPPNSAKSLAAAIAEAKKPLAVPPKTAPKLVRWYIQIGSFSKRENAMSLWESLREQGLAASLDTVQTDKGTSYRLRVGPELDGKKAAAMKARLDKQNINAILVSE